MITDRIAGTIAINHVVSASHQLDGSVLEEKKCHWDTNIGILYNYVLVKWIAKRFYEKVLMNYNKEHLLTVEINYLILLYV